MTGYKISAGTAILFYVRYPRPCSPAPFTKDSPCKKPAPYVHPYRITTFFSITIPEILFF
jgi:hypothetical protein